MAKEKLYLKFRLVEDSQLYKGIFWIKDVENPKKDLCFKIDCDSDGNSLSSEYTLNAKSGDTYNHKLLWKRLDTKLTEGKTYNYFPRGRVEIKRGVARIFLNVNLFTDYAIDFLKEEFNLNKFNGIRDIKAIVDNSQHYLCYLDKGWKPDN